MYVHAQTSLHIADIFFSILLIVVVEPRGRPNEVFFFSIKIGSFYGRIRHNTFF